MKRKGERADRNYEKVDEKRGILFVVMKRSAKRAQRRGGGRDSGVDNKGFVDTLFEKEKKKERNTFEVQNKGQSGETRPHMNWGGWECNSGWS